MERLGPLPPVILAHAVSDDGCHLALLTTRLLEKTFYVLVDGKAGRQFEAISDSSLVFSPDGTHFAYTIKIGGKQLVVVDTLRGPEYDGIDCPAVFSRDGKRLATASDD
jgi:predicted amidohydrolase